MPAAATRRRQLRLVVAGHVDHGKSTLIGRLLHDTGSLPEGKLAELEAWSEKRGMPLEWSFVLDALQAERDQAITIDTTQVWFRSAASDYVIIDAPGHREFLKNMVSGAAQADAAVLVVDAVEGVCEQTRRHAYLLQLLGLGQVVVAVNKMDLVGYAAARFAEVSGAAADYLRRLGLVPAAIVPVAARHGANLVARPAQMTWYAGDTLLEALDRLRPRQAPVERPLRLPIQDVYKFDERRILVGRIEAGVIRVGDTLLFSPSNRTARVATIERWNAPAPVLEARAGQSVGITLDQPVFVERGELASHATHAPMLTSVFRLNLFWIGERPLAVGQTLKLKLATAEARVSVQSIERVVDTESLAAAPAGEVRRNEVAEVVLRSRAMLALDPFAQNAATGRCVLVDGYDTVGAGVIGMEGYADQRGLLHPPADNLYAVEHLLTPEARAARQGHAGAIIWLTGLSGAGKSTLAMRVERELFARGLNVYVLDGDNVRRGLNADLGFGPEARAENIRRVGEVAGLFADAGCIVLSAFISPYRSDRERARAVAPERFHEVWIKADLATCEARDPKGLYRRARAGEIREFTGISAPYEEPERPELVVDTARHGIDDCVDRIVRYVLARTALQRAA